LPRVVASDLGFPRIHEKDTVMGSTDIVSSILTPTFLGSVQICSGKCTMQYRLHFCKECAFAKWSNFWEKSLHTPSFNMIFRPESWEQTEHHGQKSPNPPSSTNWILSIIAPYFFMVKNKVRAHIHRLWDPIPIIFPYYWGSLFLFPLTSTSAKPWLNHIKYI
jgi:hypothetical protein